MHTPISAAAATMPEAFQKRGSQCWRMAATSQAMTMKRMMNR